MELKCKEKYDGPLCSLLVGQTTVGMEIPAEEKERLLADFPEWFEVITGAAEKKEEELPVETPEDSLVIETPEAKMDKPRKK